MPPVPKTLSVLVLGCSYGALVAIKALAAGHAVTVVGRPDEVAAIAGGGLEVEFPATARAGPVPLASRGLAGDLRACAPEEADPGACDLVVLAMQEPQFRDPSVAALMARIAASGRPCVSVMNMPPPPYLRRIPALDGLPLGHCYAAPEVWRGLAPDRLTLCSPDPQAARPPGGALNALRVGLASNFRAARFDDAVATALLRRFAAEVNDARPSVGGRRLAVPVRIRLHDSPFVPLTKWSMLLAGNYRCVEERAVRSIRAAVLDRPEESRAVYDWVNGLLVALGAEPGDLVGFEHYARAAEQLGGPSSAARALAAGATAIERVDRLVQEVARHLGLSSAPIDGIVDRIDRRLANNRSVSA